MFHFFPFMILLSVCEVLKGQNSTITAILRIDFLELSVMQRGKIKY